MAEIGRGDEMTGKVNLLKIEENDSIPAVSEVITQNRINRWADVVSDYNPLHVDPEYAKKTKFKKTIAHGPLIISCISEMMGDWIGDYWLESGKLLDIRFKAPVKSGDQITIEGLVKEKRIEKDRIFLECEVFITNQEGVKVLEGEAIVEARM